VVLVPWVGVPAFLLFGSRKLPGAYDLKKPLALRSQATPVNVDAAAADRLIQSYALPAAVGGNRVVLGRDGTDIYAMLLDVIGSAEHRVHLATFILHPDPVGKAVIDALARRADAGLEVRLLLDGIGSFTTRAPVLAPLVEAPRRLLRWNLRNHRKVAIADDWRIVSGGANIAVEYMGPTPNPARWHDLSFLMEGPAVGDYAEIFRADWEFATGEKLPPVDRTARPPAGEVVAQIVPSGPDVPDDPLYAVIVAATFAARRRLWIVSPYFIPPDALCDALAIAAHRGVDVRILVPDPSNHPLADLARGQALRDLQAAGCTIVRFVGGMVHAKIIVVDDDLAMVGSLNVDPRSMFLNFEVVSVLYGPAAVGAVADWVEALDAGTVIGMPPVGRWRDTMEGVARMLAPLL
jgi:cardiolipin synthase